MAAEAAAQQMVEMSLRSGDYEEGRHLLEYAAAIHSLCRSIASNDRPSLAAAPSRHAVVRPSVASQREEFPKFFIEGDRLVKIGRSRAGADTPYYRHETPQEFFDLVVSWLRNILNHGNKSWSMKELELVLREREVPVYHGYNIAGALRQAGLIEPIGRGQYRIVPSRRPVDWWDYLRHSFAPVEIVEGEVRRTDGEE